MYQRKHHTDGYFWIQNSSLLHRSRQIHGRTITYLKEDLTEPVHDLNFGNFSEEMDFECSGVKLIPNSRKTAIVSILPVVSFFFIENLNTLLNLSNIFLCCDVNINYSVDSVHKYLFADILTNFHVLLHLTDKYINK